MSRPFQLVVRAGLTAIALFAAAKEVLRGPQPSTLRLPPARGTPVGKIVLVTIAALALLSAAGGLVFMYTGLYNIAGDEPHTPPVRWALIEGRTRSVRFHSRNIQAPALRDPELISRGFGLYRQNCQICHGAPGVARAQAGRGIQPTPPPMMTASFNWTDAQIYWILSNGLKLSGMPAFGVRLGERERWAIVAFIRRMQWMSPADYHEWSAAADAGSSEILRTSASDPGVAAMTAQGNPKRGRDLLRRYGCVSCHQVPEIGRARVGPPLMDFANRHIIAGKLVNTPRTAAAWIMNPQQWKPRSVMPNLGVQPSEALDIVAYLYGFGAQRRVQQMHRAGENTGD